MSESSDWMCPRCHAPMGSDEVCEHDVKPSEYLAGKRYGLYAAVPRDYCPVHTGTPEPCPDCGSKIAAGL